MRLSLIFDILPFYFNLSFTVLSFFFTLLHFELHTELDNLISMQNLRTSAKKGSNDVSVSLTQVPLQALLWWTWIWLPSPCWGSAVAPGSPPLPFVPVPCLLAMPSLLPGISVSGRTPALRFCQGCSWRLAVLAPQGLSLSVSLYAAFSVFTVSGSQRIFCPLPSLDRALGCHMSRVDALRQLAAQLSVLAELENTIAVGFSSGASQSWSRGCFSCFELTSGFCSPGSIRSVCFGALALS